MKCLVTVACAAIVWSVSGTVRTNTVKKGTTDWDSKESYEDSSFKPGANDVVIIPDGAKVYVSSDDTKSFDLVAGLSAILVGGETSEIVFDVKEGHDKLINCQILSEAGTKEMYDGRIVKKGKGRLTAGNGAGYPLGIDWNYYLVPLFVEEGEWRCAQGINPAPAEDETKKKSVYYSSVTVARDAVFRLASGNMLFTAVRGLWGDGLVTTAEGVKSQFRIIDKACTFGGVLDENVYYFSSARVELTGTSSLSKNIATVFGMKNGYAAGSGYTAVASFGMKGEPSSVGTNQSLYVNVNGGGWGYLGTGETTDKQFAWYPNASGPSLLIDGGANGGLVLAGGMVPNTHGIASVILTGSNAVSACEMAGYIQKSKGEPDKGFVDGNNVNHHFPVHITKTGSGIWKFRHSRERSLIGSITVEEGTLGIETLDEAGVDCSLGTAENLFPRIYAAQSWELPQNRIDYAIELGGDKATSICGYDSTGILELSSSALYSLYCTTRPIALTGDGVIRNATETNRMMLAGVRSLSAKAKMLTIGGNDSQTNTLADVVDTAGGAVSIVKDGSDTWILTGTNDIRGDVSVNAGTLILHNVNEQQYTWYKWVIRSNWSHVLDPDGITDRSKGIVVNEFGLFADDGSRVNSDLAYRQDYPDILPGEAAFASYHARYGTVSYANRITKLFDNKSSGDQHYFYNNPNTQNSQVLVETDPHTYRIIMMRLAEGASPAVSWDYSNIYCTTSREDLQSFNVRSSTLYASASGTDWEEVAVADRVEYPDAEYAWVFHGGKASSGHTNCNTIASHVQGEYPFMENVASFSVAAGAVIEGRGAPVIVSDVRLDASAGAGTFRNIVFAENGMLEIANATGDSDIVFEKLFDSCPTASNLASWAISVNDENTTKTVVVSNDGLALRKRGLRVIIR